MVIVDITKLGIRPHLAGRTRPQSTYRRLIPPQPKEALVQTVDMLLLNIMVPGKPGEEIPPRI